MTAYPIMVAQAWPTNAHLIADVAKLGYLDGRVLDVTYGLGTFWRRWQPTELVACDINPAKSPIGHAVDFRNLSEFGKRSFDAVVLDPPYKLNGRSTEKTDERYGVDVPAKWQDRYQLIWDGIVECSQVTRRYLLLKCMDQVVSGKKRWQTQDFTRTAWMCGMDLVDRFDMLTALRPQPEGRRQVHAHSNYSTLLVFERAG